MYITFLSCIYNENSLIVNIKTRALNPQWLAYDRTFTNILLNIIINDHMIIVKSIVHLFDNKYVLIVFKLLDY